jgi:hypothetical protein
MRAEIFVAPHERIEAIEAYDRYLSDEQAQEIEDHEGEEWLVLDIDYTNGHTVMTWKVDLAK